MQVPTETTQQVFGSGPGNDYLNVSVNPNAFGVGLGGAIAQAGDALSTAAVQKQQILNEATHTDALNQAMKAASDQLFDPKQGYLTKLGKDAIDAYPDARQQLTDTFKQIRDSLPNPAVQREFDASSFRILRNAMDTMGSHADAQTKVYDIGTLQDSIKFATQNAVNHYNDDRQFNNGLNDIAVKSGTLGAKQGMSPEQTNQIVEQNQSAAWTQRIQRMALDDPIAARKVFNENETSIIGAERYQLANMLQTRVDAQLSRQDGQVAYATAVTPPTPAALPADKGAPIVKPFTPQQLQANAAAVQKTSQYDDLFQKYATQFGVSPTELKMHAVVESGLNPNAATTAGSSAAIPNNSVGLMQFNTADPAIQKFLAANNIDPKKPEDAIRGAAMLMAQNGGGSGDMSKVDRAYYSGSTTGTGPNTEQYVENMRALRQAIQGAPLQPTTAASLEAQEAAVITAAKAQAQKTRPGDLVYQDQVVAEAHKNWANDVQALRGVETKNFQQVLELSLPGGAKSLSDLPAQVQQNFASLSPEHKEAIMNQWKRNTTGDNKSDLNVYAALATYPEEMAAMPDDKFMMLRTKLSDEDFKRFATERGNLMKNAADQSTNSIDTNSLNTSLNERLENIGINPKPQNTDLTSMAQIGTIQKYVRDDIFQQQQIVVRRQRFRPRCPRRWLFLGRLLKTFLVFLN